MFINQKPAEPLAPEHMAFFTEFMALDHDHRERVMKTIIVARKEQCIEQRSNYIYDHDEEFFSFDILSSQIVHGAYANCLVSDAPGYRVYIRRDMTYGRIVALVDLLYENVMFECDERDKVVELYNYALDASLTGKDS